MSASDDDYIKRSVITQCISQANEYFTEILDDGGLRAIFAVYLESSVTVAKALLRCIVRGVCGAIGRRANLRPLRIINLDIAAL